MRLKTTILMASVLLASAPAGASIEPLGGDSLQTAHGFPPQTAGVSSSYRPDDTAWKPVPVHAPRLLAQNGAAAIPLAAAVAPDPVSEPGGLSVLAVGLLGAGAIARRRLSA